MHSLFFFYVCHFKIFFFPFALFASPFIYSYVLRHLSQLLQFKMIPKIMSFSFFYKCSWFGFGSGISRSVSKRYVLKLSSFSFACHLVIFCWITLGLHQYPHYERKLKQKRQNISMLRLYFIFGYQYSNYIFCSPLGLKFSGMFQIQPRLSMQKMMGKFSLSLLVCLSCHLLVRRIIFQLSPPHALSPRKNDQLADFSLTPWTKFL